MKKWLTNDIGLKIISVMAASLLWLIVVNINDPVIPKEYKGISVQIQNEDSITNDGKTFQVENNTDVVNITVTAKRSVHERLDKADLLATADFKELTHTSVPIKVKSLKYDSKIENYESDPQVMQIKIDNPISKKFPISVVKNGTPKEGFVVGKLAVSPESVQINGAATAVNQISKIVAEIDVTDFGEDQTMKAPIKLLDVNGEEISAANLETSLNGENVIINVKMLRTKEVKLVFNTSGEPADGYMVKEIVSEPEKIAIAGELAVLDGIDELVIEACPVDITGYNKSKEEVIDITSYIPDNIQLVDEEQGNVLVKVQIEALGTKTLELPKLSIKVNNIPAGHTYTYTNTDDIEIICRGEAGILNVLDLGDVEASIDLSSYTSAGVYEVPIMLKLPSGCSVVGTITAGVEILEGIIENTNS